MTKTLSRNFIARWFGKAKKIVISDSVIVMHDSNLNSKEIFIEQLADFPYITQSIFGKTLILKSKKIDSTTGKSSVNVAKIWGISQQSAELFEREIKFSLNKRFAEIINSHADDYHQKVICQYLRDSNVKALTHAITPLVQCYQQARNRWQQNLTSQQLAKIEVIARMPALPNTEALRQYYEKKTLTAQASFFDGIEANPLTKEQRLAVIRNNDKNLVLAAAGTGKTSVMVAKALHLIAYDKIPAKQVLILAYNNAAANELKQRLELRKKAFGLTCQSPNIMTFHALGLALLTKVEVNTKLSTFANDTQQLERWFSQWLKNFISQTDNNMQAFLELGYLASDIFTISSKEQQESHLRDNEYLTLQGEKVTSYQVLLIANWLFLNSVQYKFKGRYPANQRLADGQCYKPSFVISRHDNTEIYLEYFELESDGSTLLCRDASLYHKDITTIKELHKAQQTTLLEMYYHEYGAGNFTKKLQTMMLANDIETVAKNHAEILNAVISSGLLAENVKRYVKCLQAIRLEQLEQQQIIQRLKNANIDNDKQYSALLIRMLQAYRKELKQQAAIDFDDMILNSLEHVNNGNYLPQWTDILVDEFQDISTARMNLLNALINKGPKPRLTVVGDDWQAIYRFSGGKLALITQFEKYSGSHSLTTLQKTFRYNNSIADTAGQFVMQNPEQYKKYINTHNQVDSAQVFLINSDKQALNSRISNLVKQIKAKDANGSIAVLARYRYLLDEAKSQLGNTNKIHYWTFHGAKGLEADYCLIIGLFSGKTGFPNVNKNDALVEALLPVGDGFKNSEERRLFYVAITRAKNKAFLIADANQPSDFVEELLSPSYQIKVLSDDFASQKRSTLKCPRCHTGYFILKTGKYGDFYQCSSHVTCQVNVSVCQQCQSPSVDNNTDSVCQSSDCKSKIKLCQKCGRAMRIRQSQYGDFWGCSGFASKVDQCTHTERADSAS